MTAILVLVLWFGTGVAGAWMATRHFELLVGTTKGSEMPSIISIVMGPIGLAGALFYMLTFPQEKPRS